MSNEMNTNGIMTNGHFNQQNSNLNKEMKNELNDNTIQANETPANKKFKTDSQQYQQYQQQKLEPEYFRKVFVGSLSYNTTEESLRKHFEQYGELVDCVIMKESKTGKSRGFGFVTYSKSTMVDEMMKYRPHKLDGRELETKRATPREESSKPGAEMTTKKLFVGAIREGINDEHLREYFSKYGKIEDCVVMREKDTNKTRGFGFVTFDDYDPVDKIVLEKNHSINGQSLAVKKALPKDQTTPSGHSQMNSPMTGSNFKKGNKFNNMNQINNNMNSVNMNRGSNGGSGRFNNNYNENYSYNSNYNMNNKNSNTSNNKNSRYNDYSDDFNMNNFNDGGFNNFPSGNNGNLSGMPMPNNMPPQLPPGMPNNFTNFALLAQKMLQAGFAAGYPNNPPIGMNNNFNNSLPNIMDRNQLNGNGSGGIGGPMRRGIKRPLLDDTSKPMNNKLNKGFDQSNNMNMNNRGNFGPMRDGGNTNRRPAPYSNARKSK